MNISTAVVLAAGEGTRLRPLTHNRPKPMLPAADQPILQHVLDALVEAGMQEIILVVGYRKERVQEHFGSHYRSTPLTYVTQDKQLGSGHALLQARTAVDGPHVVVNGDKLIDGGSVSRVVDAFDDDTISMAVVDRSNASQYGVVKLDGEQVTELQEKPDTDEHRLINAGVYAFSAEMFETIEETPRRDGELILSDAITEQIGHGDVRAVRIDGLWADATYPWDLLHVANEVFERGRVGTTTQDDGLWVDEDASVHETAVLQPPVVVGPDCEVGPSAVVGPNVSLAENTTIGANVTLERAVIDSDCRIGHGSTVVDAVLGQDVDLGVNVTVPGGPGDVRVGNEMFESQRLGAVLADRVRAVGNVAFEPGTLVGTGASIETGATVDGLVGAQTEVVR
ncbi:glucose-1-phosphate thymidylyltransferase [Halovenus aranensis]|uniref:Bifunctional protein GlmU n=1 Tax=Halovenus aranensis TaxID=890420 RepID=A0A1G8Z4X6_9EURY|nr:bifunctional sugar-1-phosphate nucleotidylyltransferase/acetyltransferase [Halovenus aranensis]SDK09270.1 glucose-1-phosphate thymidylyltransferase [Halovenus aranensis]